MAVEARHLNLFLPQMLENRQTMNHIEGNANFYNSQMGYAAPSPVTTAAGENLIPMYSSLLTDSMGQKTAVTSDSGVTYNLPTSRKRSRDSIINSFMPSYPPQKNATTFSFLGEDLSCVFQQQQLEIERLISQHMENVRMELEEKRKKQARKIIEVIGVGMIKALKAKEEEIEKMGKLNFALEERVKSLCIENQVWRDLAQTNEATANVLRINLEQALAQAQVKEERIHGAGIDNAEMDDAQSCCGSSGAEEDRKVEFTGRRTLEGEGGARTFVEDKDGGVRSNRKCRNCGQEQSCVLLLPCRHLCLCTGCGSRVHTCPVCKSTKNASVLVNMS